MSDQDASQAQGERDRAKAIRNRHLLHMAMTGEMDDFGENWAEEAAIRAMLEFAAPGATAQDGVEPPYRCKGCGWRGHDPIAIGHPQNGCDLELMVPVKVPTPTIPAGMVADSYDPMKHGMHAATEVDRIAILLFEAFAKAEPREGITRYPASYWATFADMARAVIADAAAPKQAEQQGVERAYPELLSPDEGAALLKQAEELWADLQANNLGGFRGGNRPFYIAHEFRRVIETFGHRDTGLKWSKNDLDAAALNAPTGAVEKERGA